MGDYRPKIEQRIIRQGARISALLLVALFQTALAPSLWRLRIDWMLIIVTVWTLMCGLGPGLRWGVIGGLALDFLSPLPIGAHLLSLLIVVVVVAAISDVLPRENRIVVVVTVLMAGLLYGLALALVMSIAGWPVVWQRYPLTILLPTALADTALALPVALVLQRMHRGGQPDIAFDI
jgi:rod shape-determining protein MreD